jgi:succinyl-diaminopimelate desuccinylase
MVLTKAPELFLDNEFLVKTTQDLIRIKAVNEPPLTTDYSGIIEYVERIFRGLGFSVIIAGKPNFPNIIARLKGTGKSARRLMLNAHLDTVPPGDPSRWEEEPFGGTYRDGYVYGRGACDMRGQIAMLLTLAKALVDNKVELKGELAISFVSGHETGSIDGSVYLVETNPELLAADMCLIPEPTNICISVASRGILWVKAKTVGLNGHTATYNEVRADGTAVAPINAIHKMIQFVNCLLDVDSWMKYRPNLHTGPENGMYSVKPIVEVNIISAGEKQNTIPGECTATIDIRFLPGQTPETIMEELHRLAERIKKNDPDFCISFEVDMIQSPPMDLKEDSELYQLVRRKMKAVLNRELKVCGVCAPGDAVAFGRIMPVAWLGPKWDNAHGFDERVNIEELQDLASLYYEILYEYLNQ